MSQMLNKIKCVISAFLSFLKDSIKLEQSTKSKKLSKSKLKSNVKIKEVDLGMPMLWSHQKHQGGMLNA